MEIKEVIRDKGWTDASTPEQQHLQKTIFKVFAKFNIAEDSLILDAGCGAGFVTHKIYERGYKRIYGIDLSESGIGLANKNYPEMEGRFFVHNANDRNLPDALPNEHYDVVLSTELIEHLNSPKIFLENIYHWLDDKGYVIISTPYHGYLKNLLIALFNRFDRHFNPLWEGGHIKFFSRKTLEKIMKEFKFEIVDVRGSGRLPYIWNSMLVVARKM